MLVCWPFVFGMSFQNGLSCPLVLGLDSFSFLFSSFDFEHRCIRFFCSKFLDPLDFFSSCPQALFGHFWWLRIFFYALQCCLGAFHHCGFFLSLALAPSVGCDPSQGYFQKNVTQLKKGLQRIYFSLVKGLSKMTFLHFKMHLGSISLAFTRVCKMVSHYSFS